MESNLEKITALLESSGISSKLDGRIIPTRHPKIATLLKKLGKRKKVERVDFTTYPNRDLIVIAYIEGMEYFEENSLSIMPYKSGYQAVMTAKESELHSGGMQDCILSISDFIESLTPSDELFITIVTLED